MFLKETVEVKKLENSLNPRSHIFSKPTPKVIERSNNSNVLDLSTKISILPRPTHYIISDNTKIPDSLLSPSFPYHKRWEQYQANKKAIFETADLSVVPKKTIKRSTLRFRQYFRQRKFTSKFHLSTIINNATDRRYYASVKFLSFSELGLLDTGANISCIGSELANMDFSSCNEFRPLVLRQNCGRSNAKS